MILLIIKGLSPTAMYEVDVGVGFGASATPGRARWKKRGDTLCARRHVMGFCTQGPRLGIPPCAKTAGPSAAGMGYRYLYAGMDAEGVRGICGRCVFKGDSFRTQNALQVSLVQYDCGRSPAQKGTFRKQVGDLPQTVGFASLRSARPTSLHERNMSDLPRFASHIRRPSTIKRKLSGKPDTLFVCESLREQALDGSAHKKSVRHVVTDTFV